MKFTDLTENQQKVLRKLHDNALLNALNVNKKIAWYQFTRYDVLSCMALGTHGLVECYQFTPIGEENRSLWVFLARLTAKGIKCVEEA